MSDNAAWQEAKAAKGGWAEHFSDEYVVPQQEGYRSRAVCKLQEIQERDRILYPGMKVVDLGVAPAVGVNMRLSYWLKRPDCSK